MTRRIFSLALLLSVVPMQSIATSGRIAQQESAAQKPSPTPSTEQESTDDVVRITSKLVQLDVVVTDKNGLPVTNLTADDFEISEDGNKKPITHFSYIFSGSGASPVAPRADAPTSPTAPLRRERVQRTIAVVVDDLGMSYQSMLSARLALKKLVTEQIQTGDLVAILRTGGGVGVLQQFTNNRQQLLAAVDRVRWNSCSSRGIRAVSAAGNEFEAPICAYDNTLTSIITVHSLLVAMHELPGRKSLIFFADGFPVENKEDQVWSNIAAGLPPQASGGFRQAANVNPSVLMSKSVERALSFDPVRLISEAAIRSSVVVYCVDTRAFDSLALTAADNVGKFSGAQVRQLETSRIQADKLGRYESGTVADSTGGLFIQNTNDLNSGLGRIMDDQKGYYLIGYRPGGDTFDRRFHKISARVKNRSDLHVRTRSGFFGVTEEESQPAKPTNVDRFQLALTSPFLASDIDVRMTPVFTSLPSTGPVLRSLLHISARDLTFKEQPDGWRNAELVLRGLLFGDNGRIIDEHRRAFTVRVRGATFDRIQSQGFDYVFNMPAKKPGAYQFRVAILDTISSRVGSAGQYVEIPDLKKKQVALSGIVLNEVASGGAPGAATSAADVTEGPLREANSGARRFRINSSLNYDYLIFNAGGNPASGKLNALVRLFQDGKQVFEHESPAEVLQQIDPSRTLIGGRLTLGTNLKPGEYILQITVTDPSAKKGQGTATEAAAFEIVQ